MKLKPTKRPSRPALAYATISVAVNEVFSRDELIKVAERIATLRGTTYDKPLEENTEGIRCFITTWLKEIYDSQPEMLMTIQSTIDAITSSALQKS